MATQQETEFRQKAQRLRDELLELNKEFWNLRNGQQLEDVDEDFIYDQYSAMEKFCQTLPFEPTLIAKLLTKKG